MVKQVHLDKLFKFRLRHSYLGEVNYAGFHKIPEKHICEIYKTRPSLLDCIPLTEDEAKPYLEHKAVLPPYKVDFDATIYIEVKNAIPVVPFYRTPSFSPPDEKK